MRKAYENIGQIELPFVHVENYNEKEETTCIEVALLLKTNCFKRWVIVPILSLLSIFVFAVFLYWKKPLQRDWLYSRARSIKDATHIYIEGQGKIKNVFKLIYFDLDGNKEIVELKDMSNTVQNANDGFGFDISPLSTIFTYRFINFEWVEIDEVFKPIKFNCYLPFDELRQTFTDPSRLGN